jgi:hypothetical protein
VSRPTDRQLHRLAWACWWFFVVALLARVGLTIAEEAFTPAGLAEMVSFLLVLVAFPLAGLAILHRQPRNTIGWLLMGIGVVWSVGGYADTWAHYGLITNPGSLPGAAVGGTIANGIWAPALGLTGTYLFLLFPDGHLPSPRWRPFAWAVAGVLVTLVATLILSPEELVEGPGAGIHNPLGVEALGPALQVVVPMLILLFALSIVTSATALVVRFRRSHGIERLQVKWLAAAAATVGGVFLLGVLTSSVFPEEADTAWQELLDQLSFLLFALLPLSIGVAVLRYRLYDIDVVINRALVYGSLTALLAGVYLGSVLLLQLVLRPLTEQSDLAVAASTLAVAALFGPARRRIQVAVDRRFYRHKYDAARTVADFSTRLRQQIDLDAIGTDLVRIAGDAVQPTDASLWLRPVTVPGRSAPRKDSP